MKTNQKNVLVAAIMLFAVNANAQIDNLTNMSPEWIRTAARNASTDGTDAVVYNPAGLTKQTPGFHLSIGNQSLFRSPSHEYDLGFGTQKFEQDGSDAFLPNLFMSYTNNKWAMFGGMYISGGGATANYPKGSINTDLISMLALMNAQGAYMEVKDQHLKASSYYLTSTVGGSYSVNEKFSLGGGIRLLNGKNKIKAGMTLSTSPLELPDAPLAVEAEDKASSFGGVFSMNVSPSEKINMSVRYETKVALEFETTTITDDLGATVDGAKNHRDLPAVFAFGMGFNINEKFHAAAEMNYYFQKNADWGTTMTMNGEMPLSELAGDASTYAASFEYKFTPKFLASIGTVYSSFNFTDRDAYYTSIGAFETVPGNNVSVNTGFAYKVSDKLKINCGLAKTMWAKDTKVKALNAYPYDLDVTVNNSMTTFAVGIDIGF